MTSPDRRGMWINTVVWAGALAALAALTVWKFGLWPTGLDGTPTGVVAAPATDAERETFVAAPIALADAGGPSTTDLPPPPQGESAAPRPLPPSEMKALRLDAPLPPDPLDEPAAWPSGLPETRRVASSVRPARSAAGGMAAGAEFGESGRFPAGDFATDFASGEVRSGDFAAPPQDDFPPDAPLQDSSFQGERTAESPFASPPALLETPPTLDSKLQPAAAETVAPGDPRVAEIDKSLAADDALAAHKALSKLYWDAPELRPVIQTRIDGTAKRIYFDPQPHYMPPYEVKPGDQMAAFARRYNVPWEYLAKLNGVDPQRIREGQKLKVIKGPFSAFVNLNDYTLTVHAHGYYVRRYRVGVGKEGTTPLGAFHVVLKETNPKYWGPNGNVMERDDPANPLGERWLGLDDGSGRPSSYGIHGTIDPASIGKSASAGCVRLNNDDVAELYDLLGVGSEVVIQR